MEQVRPTITIPHAFGTRVRLHETNRRRRRTYRAKSTDNEEFVLPTRKCSLDVADAVSQKTTRSSSNTLSSKPYTDSDRLLFPSVPHLGDDHEARVGSRFSGSCQSPGDSKGLELITSGLEHEKKAPQEDLSTKIL